MEMTLTLKEAVTRLGVENMPEEIKEFGLYGRFVYCDKTRYHENSAIYFLYGTDKKMILNPDIDHTLYNMEKTFAENYSFYFLDCLAEKISGCDISVARTHIFHNCRKVNCAIQVYDEFNKPLPRKISAFGMRMMMYYFPCTRNPQLSVSKRRKYALLLADLINNEDSFVNPENELYEKNGKGLKLAYDCTKGLTYNKIRYALKREKNRMSLDALVRNAGDITTGSLSVGVAKKLRKELRNYPYIAYYMSNICHKKARFSDTDCFGPNKEDGDYRDVFFGVAKSDIKVVATLIKQIVYPDEPFNKADEIIAEGRGIGWCSVDEDLFPSFLSLCKANGVRYSIDTQYSTNLSSDIFHVCYPANYQPMVTAIIKRLDKEYSHFKIDLPKLDNSLAAAQKSRDIFSGYETIGGSYYIPPEVKKQLDGYGH